AAPGKIATMSDGWTADNTKGSFLGMTAHWIELQTVTLDNASNNNTSCEMIEHQHNRRLLECLEHVVNLANVAIMTHITKIAAIENANTIWEYDPELPGNQVLGGSLNVVVAIRTLAAVDLFVTSADQLYGPITTLRREGRIVKKILWSAFKLSNRDWMRVLDTRNILAHQFLAEKQPTLWRALPLIEELQMAWEAKHDDPRYVLYQGAIQDGLDKLKKYYSRFDQKLAFILALVVLHPYYKLAYIKLAWGGAEEQAAEKMAGNRNAKNWKDEA
ncbi:hypothetical protein L208DRAFT_1074551, partial [Tricholoma matsutake]